MEPRAPSEEHETTRNAIIAELMQGPSSARELSAVIRISEREVSGHLEHIRKSLDSATLRLVIVPAECKKCGFIFAKREKFQRPGKCPLCKSESIREPLFVIEKKKG